MQAKLKDLIGSLSWIHNYKVEIDGIIHRYQVDQLILAKRDFLISHEHRNKDDGMFMPASTTEENQQLIQKLFINILSYVIIPKRITNLQTIKF